jgi:serine protease Do
VEDSPAEKAGLERYDVIIELEGEPVANYNEFRNKVAMVQPGTEVAITILRDGERKEITVELGERPREGSGGRGAGRDEPDVVEQLGFKIQELTEELAHAYDTMSGVIVSSVERGSEAHRKGMRIGMLIQEVNRKKVTSIEEFNEAMEEVSKEEKVLFLVHNGSYNRFIVLNIPKDEE